MAEHLPRRRVHRAPAPERRERLGEGVVATGQVGEQEAHPLQALAAEPALLEREEGALAGGTRGRRAPSRRELLDAEREAEDARVDLGRLGEARGRRLRSVGWNAPVSTRHPSSV